jgi:hypothetical protein
MSHHASDSGRIVDQISRREFTLDAALAILATCVITVSEDACSSSTPAAPTAPPADINGSVSANHGHIAVVTGAQIVTGTGLTLNIQGTAAHNHTLTITNSDLTNLKNKQAVSETSSTDSSHQHTVTFSPS